jgi:hypothetical protein
VLARLAAGLAAKVGFSVLVSLFMASFKATDLSNAVLEENVTVPF